MWPRGYMVAVFEFVKKNINTFVSILSNTEKNINRLNWNGEATKSEWKTYINGMYGSTKKWKYKYKKENVKHNSGERDFL